MDKERIAELREWLADTDLAIRGLLRHQYLLIWQERKCIADLLLLLDECEKTRAGDKETDPFLANLYGIKSRGSSNVGIEHQPDGPGSSPGPRSPAPPGQVEERREMLDAIDDAILTWAAEEGYYRPEDKKPWQKIRALILAPPAPPAESRQEPRHDVGIDAPKSKLERFLDEDRAPAPPRNVTMGLVRDRLREVGIDVEQDAVEKMGEEERNELDKFLITMMSYMKTSYDDADVPWEEYDEKRFLAIRALILSDRKPEPGPTVEPGPCKSTAEGSTPSPGFPKTVSREVYFKAKHKWATAITGWGESDLSANEIFDGIAKALGIEEGK